MSDRSVASYLFIMHVLAFHRRPSLDLGNPLLQRCCLFFIKDVTQNEVSISVEEQLLVLGDGICFVKGSHLVGYEALFGGWLLAVGLIPYL